MAGLTQKQDQLDYVACELLNSPAGRIHGSARHAFGAGYPDADLVILGEAPGFEADRDGAPFPSDSPSGRVLDSLLRKAGLDRERAYTTNVMKQRPPMNRNPKPEEVELLEPFLHRQLAIIQPRVILALGRVAANVVSTFTLGPIGALRQLNNLWFTHDKLSLDIPVVATYHPAHVLRKIKDDPEVLRASAGDFKRVWEILND